MSLPPLTPPTPTPAADARRRTETIANRKAGLRTMGTAGAIAALGVFTGLAATHHASSAATPTPVAQTATDGIVAADATDSATQASSDFFTQQGQTGISPATGSAAATTSSTS